MLQLHATALSRLINCNGSKNVAGAQAPVISGGDEGAAAQWLAQYCGQTGVVPASLIGQNSPNGVFVTDDIANAASEFLAVVMRHETTYRVFGFDATFADPRGRWQVNGVADCVTIHGQTLYVDQLIYGWGVVEPENNYALISLALGWVLRHDWKPESLVLTVHQPRVAHPLGPVREMSVDLRRFMGTFKTSIFEVLSAPGDELRSGLSWCRRCPALGSCQAARGAAMNAIDCAGKNTSEVLDNQTLALEMDALERAQKAIENRLDALQSITAERVTAGEIVGDYGLFESYGQRRWKPGTTPEMLDLITGKDLRKPTTLVTPAEAERLGVAPEAVTAFVHRPKNKPKLAKVDTQKRAKLALTGVEKRGSK